MNASNAFRKTLTFGLNLKNCIVVGLCCYVTMLSIIALTHDHTAHAHSEETCTACFCSSQQVGVEIGSFALIFPFLFGAALLLYETLFLPLTFTTNTRSRAPPIFSNTLSIAVC